MCLDGWYFNFPEASFLTLISVVIDDWRLSSIKTDIWYKRSFLSIAGAKVQQFGVENKFLGYRFFRGVYKCLTDSVLQWYFRNQLLHFDWFRRKWRLVTQNFRKAVIWSWSCSVKIVFGSARSSYNIIYIIFILYYRPFWPIQISFWPKMTLTKWPDFVFFIASVLVYKM